MELQIEDSAQEIKRLQRCMNDLVSLLALPAIWRGYEPSQVVQTLLGVLLNMLSLDFAYARLSDAFGAMPVEILQVAEDSKINLPAQDLRDRLGGPSASYAQGSLPQIWNRSGVEDISIFPVPLGIQGEIGVIVLGSNRTGFPEKTESLLLTVAANQASIGLQAARLLSEQKRISTDLEQRVAERTRALAQTNEELKRSEERWRSVFESSAVGVALADLNGRFIGTNPIFQEMLGYTEEELQQLTFVDITHEEDLDPNEANIRELLGGTTPAISDREAIPAQRRQVRVGTKQRFYRARHGTGAPIFDGALRRHYATESVGRSSGQGKIGTHKGGEHHQPRSSNRFDRARSQPTALGNHHQCQHLLADAFRRYPKHRGRAGNGPAHDSRWQPGL
jgi:PAS domain S-box-containing protein